MTEKDFPVFEEAFKRMGGVLRLRLKGPELEELTRSYFRILEDESIERVLTAGKQCLLAYKTFPKPAEWIAALPAEEHQARRGEAKVSVLSEEEAKELHRAERLRYQDDPCECPLCTFAGVTHLSLRYVPAFDDDGRDQRAIDPYSKREVVPGYWIHGEELARWYGAKEAFFALLVRAPRIARMLEVATAMASTREPGEEG